MNDTRHSCLDSTFLAMEDFAGRSIPYVEFLESVIQDKCAGTLRSCFGLRTLNDDAYEENV